MEHEDIFTKQEIIDRLQSVSLDLIKWVSEQRDENFSRSVNEKWSIAQQIDHLTKSVMPLNMILAKPKIIIKLLFGTANRSTKKYQEVVDKYHVKLGQGGKSTKRFLPKSYKAKDKKNLIVSYSKESENLARIINRFSENELDKYVIPHPLLGKLTVREMLFFTIYHTIHHHKSLIQLY